MNNTIYCAGPITGLSYDEVTSYYQKVFYRLKEAGYDPLCPLCGKEYLKNETNLKASGYSYPLSTNHAIIERDRWMVKKSSIILINLFAAKKVSIGTMMELAWAHDNGIHTVLVMEKDNIHEHAFVFEAADVHYESLEDALVYLERLIKGI